MYNTRLTKTYFTGSQAQVYIGNSLLDEIINIEGVLEVPQYPIYGYASQHFDTVATGRVIAMGSFTINYVFDGYLYAHILDCQRDQAALDNATKDVKNTDVTNMMPNKDLDNQLYGISQPYIESLKEKFWKTNELENARSIRPEFVGPLTIKIKDYRVGYPTVTKSEDLRSLYEEKIFIEVFINKYSTMRQTTAAQTVETYQFIAKTLV